MGQVIGESKIGCITLKGRIITVGVGNTAISFTSNEFLEFKKMVLEASNALVLPEN